MIAILTGSLADSWIVTHHSLTHKTFVLTGESQRATIIDDVIAEGGDSVSGKFEGQHKKVTDRYRVTGPFVSKEYVKAMGPKIFPFAASSHAQECDNVRWPVWTISLISRGKISSYGRLWKNSLPVSVVKYLKSTSFPGFLSSGEKWSKLQRANCVWRH